MLSHVELKKGVQFVLQGEPYEVLEHSLVFKGRGSSVMQARVKNLKTGGVFNRTFHTGDEFEEAELEKLEARFVYSHRGMYVFAEAQNSSKRFELTEEQIGAAKHYLKTNEVVEGLRFQGEVINISLPIKVQLRVTEAPPGVKGDRAQGGTKTVTLETEAAVQAPLFVEAGDVIEVNTETGEYVRRV